MAVFSEGPWRQPERNNFEVGGRGGSHDWFYRSIGWLFFMKNPDWNEGHCQSLPALLFRTFRTLAHIRTEDAKYVAAIWITNWIKRSSAAICVSGTALWDACCPFAWQALGFENMMAVLRGPAMQLTCNTHATHSQHNTQHEHFSCKFSMNVRISRGWPRIRSWNANIRFWYRTRIVMENLQEKCSCCVLCWLCVACVLHVSCMAGPRKHSHHVFKA